MRGNRSQVFSVRPDFGGTNAGMLGDTAIRGILDARHLRLPRNPAAHDFYRKMCFITATIIMDMRLRGRARQPDPAGPGNSRQPCRGKSGSSLFFASREPSAGFRYGRPEFLALPSGTPPRAGIMLHRLKKEGFREMESNMPEYEPGVERVFQTKAETKAFYNRISRFYDLLAERSEHAVREQGLAELCRPPESACWKSGSARDTA